MKIFIAKGRTIIFTSISLCIFLFFVSLVTFLSTKAHRDNLNPLVIIDPGHGGEDGGASGNGIIEKDLTLKISKYMKQRFDELGIPNQMTRTEDVTLNPTDRVKKVLSFYGDGKDVIVLSNHINAGGDEFTYHYII